MFWVWIIFKIIIIKQIIILGKVMIPNYHKLFKILIKYNFTNQTNLLHMIQFNKIILKKVILGFKWLHLEIQYHQLKMKILLRKELRCQNLIKNEVKV